MQTRATHEKLTVLANVRTESKDFSGKYFAEHWIISVLLDQLY